MSYTSHEIKHELRQVSNEVATMISKRLEQNLPDVEFWLRITVWYDSPNVEIPVVNTMIDLSMASSHNIFDELIDLFESTYNEDVVYNYDKVYLDEIK